MATDISNTSKITSSTIRHIYELPQAFSVVQGLFIGGGVSYALHNQGSVLQAGIAIIMPYIYCGYHVVKNAAKIQNFLKK